MEIPSPPPLKAPFWAPSSSLVPGPLGVIPPRCLGQLSPVVPLLPSPGSSTFPSFSLSSDCSLIGRRHGPYRFDGRFNEMSPRFSGTLQLLSATIAKSRHFFSQLSWLSACPFPAHFFLDISFPSSHEDTHGSSRNLVTSGYFATAFLPPRTSYVLSPLGYFPFSRSPLLILQRAGLDCLVLLKLSYFFHV